MAIASTVSGSGSRSVGSPLETAPPCSDLPLRKVGLVSCPATVWATWRDHLERLRREGRMQFIVGQQLDAAVEIAARVCSEKSVPACSSAPIASSACWKATRSSRSSRRGTAAPEPRPRPPCLGDLQFGPVLDVAVDADRVAHVLRLHDQGDAVGERADDRMHGRLRHCQASQRRRRPLRQRRRLGFAQRDVFLAAEAARGDGLARSLRRQHRAHGMVEVEIFARDAVHVFDRHFFDARQIVIRGLEAVDGDRFRPHRRQAVDRILLKLGAAPLLQLGCRDQIRRHALRLRSS